MASPAIGVKLVHLLNKKPWMSFLVVVFFPSFTKCQIEGQIRLVNGPTANQGRIEIYHSGQWGTVCDDSWDDSDARVVCRQLGYSGGVGVARGSATYGQGSGPIYLDDVGCWGYEYWLNDCSNQGWGNHNCGHHEDAGADCSNDAGAEGDVRLVDGSSSNQGRVEVYHDGLWGTVCDDSWDDYDASVVCRQLGYSGNAYASSLGAYGQGTGPIHLDDVHCLGTESRLTHCTHSGLGAHNCGHSEDAGVSCENVSEGEIRLVGGLTANQGRVEIFHDGVWGTVCDDNWGNLDARVVCRQLGYSGDVGVAYNGGTFGQGSGSIHLDDVFCWGSESRLAYCSHGGWGNHNCGHSEDAGVSCEDGTEGDVRLVDGSTANQGRVEIFHNGLWGSVCDDSWDDSDARVVCRQLGYSGDVGEARGSGTYGQGSGPIYLDNVFCLGSESRLTYCSHDGWGTHNCVHSEDAGAYCYYDGIDGRIRLVDGSSSNEGRVEIFYSGQWGTVCDDNWDAFDARVVCRQLGYSGDAEARRLATYGQGSGPIHLDDVGCSGSEHTLANCSNGGWGNNDCGHTEDAGVYCFDDGMDGRIRLVNGASSNEGRVEIFYNGQWGTVCDDQWDDVDARVVCRQIGYSGDAKSVTDATYGPGSDPILLDDVGCFGYESRLTECRSLGWGNHNCGHSEDAGVYCYDDGTDGRIRLVDGSTANEGRVEILYYGQWGTVCDDNWDVLDAKVVCRQLGYSGDAVAKSNGAYGQGSGPIYLDEVTCSGSESTLNECSHIGWGVNDCTHSEDAGVYCFDDPSADQPSRVVSVLASVGVCLSLLTLLAIAVVCWTCSKSKPAVRPVQSEPAIHLNTLRVHPTAGNNIPMASASSGTPNVLYPPVPGQQPARIHPSVNPLAEPVA